ncbi:ATP-binding cassette domain-containing protein [Eubacterium sp. MSJ-33]|uniref:ATP-binding cassette domain-containing protein n=1 Tax=Eubacterium sp. MSJ-33 TaxID=2841528 RepID=UPI001C786DDE|nr:ABC transporter ATP-binding protein [Eubacterium sp. MSJ-33]QWT52997.1 ABC transporter ATP-binding protein [Eubacterium sp. MSJ-33]
MFQIEHISKSYGKKQVLNDISFVVPDGSAIGILGANGSGKSTLLSCIAKKYSAGSKVRFGYVPQENPLFDELKPIDNLRMWTNKKKPEILSLLTTPPLCKLGIQNFLDTPVKNMSGGMKKRLSLACALLEHPQILLMDEPFAALDLPAKQDALQFMQYYLGLGNSILIASHEEAVFQFCSHVYLLQNGTLTNASALPEGTSYIDLLRR